MKQLHIRISDELHAGLVRRAKQSGRTLHSEIVASLESAKVAVVGKVLSDGTVEINENYRRYLIGEDPIDPRD